LDLDAPAGGFAAVLPVSRDLSADETRAVRSQTMSANQIERLQSMLPHMQRYVHLDLKGAAPKVSYFSWLFPLLKELGATGLLIG